LEDRLWMRMEKLSYFGGLMKADELYGEVHGDVEDGRKHVFINNLL